MHIYSVSAWKAALVLENSFVTGSRFETKSNKIYGNLCYGLTGLSIGNFILSSPASLAVPGKGFYCTGSCQVVLSTSFTITPHIVPTYEPTLNYMHKHGLGTAAKLNPD